jgi:hypothetical protein
MRKSGKPTALGESTLVSNIKPIPMPEGAVPPRAPSERGGTINLSFDEHGLESLLSCVEVVVVGLGADMVHVADRTTPKDRAARIWRGEVVILRGAASGEFR